MSNKLPLLARSKGFSQAQLEDETGIGHSTMSRYWSGRGGLGLKNGRRIARALGVEISLLGLSEEAEAVGDLVEIRRALAALEGTVETMKAAETKLVGRVTALELELAEPQPRRGEPRRDQPAQKRRATG